MAPMKRESRPRNLGAFLPVGVLNRLSVRMDQESRLAALWRRHAPAPLVDHITAVNFTGGVLSLQAHSAAWASRARHQQRDLMARLRAEPCFQGLRELRIRVRPAEGKATSSAPRTQPTRLSTQAAKLVTATAAGITDPDLPAALTRLGTRAGNAAAPRKPER